MFAPFGLDAAARAKSWKNINGVSWLVLTYNGKTERFLGWTAEAKYFWETGQTKAEIQSQQQNDIYSTLESHSKAIIELQEIVNRQNAIIADLSNQLQNSPSSLSSASALQVWTDLDGNSFVGSFQHFDLGNVYIKKFSDGRIYDIPKTRLSPICQELALALDSFN
jgi:hypothetical protein